jgi:hypothetical protein
LVAAFKIEGVRQFVLDAWMDLDAWMEMTANSEFARDRLRREFFNLFNRVNFGFPGSTVGTPGYGVIQSAGDARMVQIGLKLAF